MNKEKKGLVQWIIKKIQSFSMSTQMILTVVLIFLIFFLVQIILNYYFFQNYYADKTFNDIENELQVYVSTMNQENVDYYDEMYKFTTEVNAISVITTKDFILDNSQYNSYTITVTDTSNNETYEMKVPNIDYAYTVNETLTISGFEFSEGVITPISISNANNTYSFDSGLTCEESCISINQATVLDIQKPANLNFEFENSQLLLEEIRLLKTGSRNLADSSYIQNGNTAYFYQAEIENQDVLVFIDELGNFYLILTIIPIEDTTSIISIVSSYNNYVYLLAILIVFAWSFRLSKVLSKPVQNIESVARQIANLNFDVEVHEYNNRENHSLSKSINLISRNLKETLDTLNNQNDELMGLYSEQTKQVSLKKQLVSSISHELKTPLMIMQVTIQGILDGVIPKDDVEYELNNVLSEINKSSFMIQDMLQIYRLEDANTTLELSEFNLSREVLSLVSDFEHNLKKHNLKLDLNLDKNVSIEADFKLIKRVLSNFLTNAIKYTPEGERIYIEVSEKVDHYYFELTNYGVQINEADLENIWMPFFRTSDYENNRLPTKGSGIGLYLVSEVLKAHRSDYGIKNIDNAVQAYFTIKKGFK